MFSYIRELEWRWYYGDGCNVDSFCYNGIHGEAETGVVIEPIDGERRKMYVLFKKNMTDKKRQLISNI